MKKIECIIRPTKLENVKEALGKFGVKGMTITNVFGCGLQLGRTEIYRGTEVNINLLPKIKLELVISDVNLDKAISIIKEEAYSGKIGDGKIFIYTLDDAVRIRTGETGESAI
jgi:nitrogen regulatory protein P-II 1